MVGANMHGKWGASVQEAHMQRMFNAALVVTGVMISVIASPNRTVAVSEVKGETPNVAVIDGLHVAVPDNMKAFPAELVPIP
jgi:hypothetical protein